MPDRSFRCFQDSPITDIARPRRPVGDPDRAIALEFALEEGFYELLRSAVAAGWTESEASRTMLDILHEHLTDIAGIAATGEDLEALARSTP